MASKLLLPAKLVNIASNPTEGGVAKYLFCNTPYFFQGIARGRCKAIPFAAPPFPEDYTNVQRKNAFRGGAAFGPILFAKGTDKGERPRQSGGKMERWKDGKMGRQQGGKAAKISWAFRQRCPQAFRQPVPFSAAPAGRCRAWSQSRQCRR